MSRLPPYHVARTRLTDCCRSEDAPVVVIEAAAGYGKSVLAAELLDIWGAVPVDVLLEEGPVSATLFAGRLRAAVTWAGFLDTAAAMGAAGDDPAGAIDAMLAGLAGETCAFVIDDAHHAGRDAGLLIDRIASRLARPQRMIVLARRLPPGTERLRRAEAVVLGAADLALRSEETLALCRTGFGLEVTNDDIRLLEAATDGWTAAAVLAAARSRRTARPLRDLALLDARSPHAVQTSDAVAVILEEVLAALGTRQSLLSQIAPLPLLDDELVAAVTGEPRFLEEAVGLGLPLTPLSDDWWELPGPVRDHFAALGPPNPDALVRAAEHYERHGRLGSALEMLLAAGEEEAAARLLAESDLQAADRVDALELLDSYERIAEPVRVRYPWAGFQVARVCGDAALLAIRARILESLRDNVAAHDDAKLVRAVDAERALDMLNVGRPLDGEILGRQVLAAATDAETSTRGRALTAVGQGLCFYREPDGRISESALREAGRNFEQAAKIYRAAGQRDRASGIVAPRAMWTELGAGRATVALEVLNDGLVDCSGRPIRFARLLFYRSQVLVELGRHDEATSDLDEVERIGRQQADPLLCAFAHIGRMTVASMRGAPEEVVVSANAVEASRGDWWSAVGADFLAEAADCLDRVGYTAAAKEYLARAKEEPHGPERNIALAECALLARHGDPIAAEAQLADVQRHGIFPKEYWRVTLLRAYAAWRRGDVAAGALAAKAFEEAARIGQPQAPLIRERDLTQSLLALAIETGSPAAIAMQATSLPLGLALFGRFELTRGGRAVAIGAGQAAQLLKLIAVNDGRIHAERAIETLWSNVDPVAGRNRLRTVLGRLRELAADVVDREGDVLVLGSEVRLDLTDFQREARQAKAFGLSDPRAAVALAGSAIARYRGDLLPEDQYEEWADAPRERARSTMLDLLDLCAEAAAERGDLDEARRLVQRTIELAPYEDDRYLRVAEILNQQGRRGAALSVIRRARSTLATLGVELPPQLLDLQRSLARVKTG